MGNGKNPATHPQSLPHLLQAGGSSQCQALAVAVPSWMPSTGFALGFPCSIIPPPFSMRSPRAQTVPGKSGHNILEQEEAATGSEILSSSPISGNRQIFAGKVTN